MGLNISPSIWQSYSNAILDCLQSRKYCEAIMDDLLLFTTSKDSHMNKFEDLLKNGLKISPKKCQLFKTSLQCMGNKIFIQNRKVCVQPLRNKTGSNSKITTLKDSKRMQEFCRYGELLKHVLPRTTETVKTHK